MNATKIAVGQSVETQLGPGEKHSYVVVAPANHFFHVRVDQRGIDAVIHALDPGGGLIEEFDGHWKGWEAGFIIAATPGSYEIQVTTRSKARGNYRVSVIESRPAAPQDKERLLANRLLTEAKRLVNLGTKESLDSALQKYLSTLPLWRTAADASGEAQTLNSIGYIHNAFGKFEDAMTCYQRALFLRQEIGETAGEAETLLNIAANYSALGNKTSALQYYDQTFRMFVELKDRMGQAFVLSNIAAVHYTLGECRRSLEIFGQALPIWQEIEHSIGEIQVLVGFGCNYLAIGDYHRAFDYLQKALLRATQAGDARGGTYALFNLGMLHHEVGDPKKALPYLWQVRERANAMEDRRTEATTLTDIASCQSMLQNYNDSLKAAKEAREIAHLLGDRRTEAYALLAMATSYIGLNRTDVARESANSALQLMRDIGDLRGQALALHHMGRCASTDGQYRQAIVVLSEAVSLLKSTNYRLGEANCLLDLADAWRRMDKLEEARNSIEQALVLVESLRTAIPSDRLRLTYSSNKRKLFEFYIDLLIQLQERDGHTSHWATALQANERALARGLLDVLTRSGTDIELVTDSELYERDRDIRTKINARAARVFWAGRAGFRVQDVPAEIEELEKLLDDYEQLQSLLCARNPHYAALTRPPFIDLLQIQQDLLDEDTILLEYCLCDERSFLWLVTDTDLRVFVLPSRQQIEIAVRRLYRLLSSGPFSTETGSTQPWSEAGVTDYVIQASTVSQVLLAPIAAHLKGKRILVVPDGILHYIPFGVLPVPGTSRSAPNTGESSPELWTPLLEHNEVVYLPSVSVLAALRSRKRREAPKGIAIFADAVFDADDERVRRRVIDDTVQSATAVESSEFASEVVFQRSLEESGLLGPNQRLSRLPFSRKEALRIRMLFAEDQVRCALGFEASRKNVLDQHTGRYRILHLATHGCVNNTRPELSGLVLSIVDELGQPQEGFLRLHDIYNMKLFADLVVLSACQTALGEEVHGEGLIGLTRGFMYAGASRVVASLWKIDDEASAQLMVEFYTEMMTGNGMPASAALRKAQLAVRAQRRWRHPYYWAGFIFQGEWR